MGSPEKLRSRFEPHADNGFFGPGSVTWRVWSYPSSLSTGFQRAVTIEQLDPNLIAAVDTAGGVRARTHTRYDRTMRYFSLVAFGASEPAVRAADVLVKIHSKAIGMDPVTGAEYDANRPDSQLWIHMTAWHSILLCYERFGPGRLTPADEQQYWTECAIAAELQTIDTATVPRSRDEVRAYFDAWRPRLAASEAAQSMTAYILRTEHSYPPDMSRLGKLLVIPVARLIGRGTVSTYPRHIRTLFGLRQSRLTDALVRWPLRLANAYLYRDPRRAIKVLEYLSPSTAPIVAPALLGIPAADPETVSPREAQRRCGLDVPAEAHPEFRARQRDRVFNRGEAPSDEGLIESQQHIGSLDPHRAGMPT